MNNLRPTKFDQIVGNENLKQCLQIAIKSAKMRNDVLGHCLFKGFSGCGKTTFALATVSELGSKAYLTNGGCIRNVKDVLPYLVRLARGDVLFIDEVHRIPHKVMECLYTVMEDFRLDIAKGATSISFQPFTLIGATTEAGVLLQPFNDRFIHQFTLEDYSIDELSKIIKINASKMQINVNTDAIVNIAKRSRFTPRIANSLLRFCRDCVIVGGGDSLDCGVVERAMKLKKIDKNGLDTSDRQYIMVLRRAGKPVGLNTLVATTGLSRETIENQVEPYLLKLNVIQKESKGRSLV